MEFKQDENFVPLLEYNWAQKGALSTLLEPIKALGIDFFIYKSVYNDGRLVFLCTDQAWLQQRFFPAPCSSTVLRKQIRGIPENHFKAFLWADTPDDPVYNLLREHKISNGISLYRKTSSFLESFHLASKNEQVNLPLLLINEHLMIENFFYFFTQTAKGIITPKNSIIKLNNIDYLNNSDISNRKTLILKKILFDTPDGQILLSKRESEILFLLTRLMSSKEIGKHLNISHRTVEVILQNIKDKTGITSRCEMFKYIEKNNLINYFKAIPL